MPDVPFPPTGRLDGMDFMQQAPAAALAVLASSTPPASAPW
ncbi:hypothetical protein [Arthrobacter sp. JCM 19049]|nr:hypothetical protein [Arthrobacter sp. JCM 19049]